MVIVSGNCHLARNLLARLVARHGAFEFLLAAAHRRQRARPAFAVGADIRKRQLATAALVGRDAATGRGGIGLAAGPPRRGPPAIVLVRGGAAAGFAWPHQRRPLRAVRVGGFGLGAFARFLLGGQTLLFLALAAFGFGAFLGAALVFLGAALSRPRQRACGPRLRAPWLPRGRACAPPSRFRKAG
jgi:hypothetical protein